MTCASLTPASTDAIETLPDALVAGGVRVQLAYDHRTTVVTLIGAARCELALVKDGEIRSWWSIAAGDPGWTRLLLAVGALVGRGDIEVRMDPAVDVPAWSKGESMPVIRSHTALVTWSVSEPGSDRVLARSAQAIAAATATDPDVQAALEASEALGGIRAPSPVTDPDHRRALEHLLGGPAGTPQAIGRVHVEVHVDETLLTDDGLIRRLGTIGRLDEQVAPWLPGPGAFIGDMAGWPLQPSAALHATTEQVDALVARVATVHLLGTRTGGTTSWHRLDVPAGTDDPLGPLRLAVRLGRRSACRVRRLVLPGDVAPFTMVNGTLQARTSGPTMREVPTVTGPDTTGAAAAFWAPHDLPDLRGLAGLPLAPASLAPRRENELWPEDPTVDLGVEFREVWAVPDLGPIEVRYAVEGDGRAGLVQAHDTAAWRPALTADRSGHLVEQPSPCSYCRTVTCARCDAATQPCWLCATAVCGRCGTLVAGGPACPACRSLERLGWRGRRRKPTIDGASLEAEDARHRVLVAPIETRGARVLRVPTGGEGSTVEVALLPAQRDHLNEIARKPLFR